MSKKVYDLVIEAVGDILITTSDTGYQIVKIETVRNPWLVIQTLSKKKGKE